MNTPILVWLQQIGTDECKCFISDCEERAKYVWWSRGVNMDTPYPVCNQHRSIGAIKAYERNEK